MDSRYSQWNNDLPVIYTYDSIKWSDFKSNNIQLFGLIRTHKTTNLYCMNYRSKSTSFCADYMNLRFY